MPGGVPVATVALNGAKNAGILAVQILATNDLKLNERLLNYKKEMQHSVDISVQNIKSEGWENSFDPQ